MCSFNGWSTRLVMYGNNRPKRGASAAKLRGCGIQMVNPETPLLTPRLALEPLSTAHAQKLFSSLGDERLYAYIPQDPPTSVAALTERYTRLSRRLSPDGREIWLNWALRSRTDSFYVGVVEVTARADDSALLAYMIFTPFQGQGYAREACVRVLDHLANDYGTRLVIADIDTRNRPSIALAEALGFARTAITQDADYFKRASSDEYRYELRLAPFAESSVRSGQPAK